MLELVVAGTVGVLGHLKTRSFVRRRLRYTPWVDKASLPLWAGGIAALVAAPLVALLPFVGGGTALAFGIGVGSGVAIGAKQVQEGWTPSD